MNVSTSLKDNVGALPRVAIVGRPNVGKSTLFNRLVGYRRAITDEMPGVTRDLNDAVVEIGRRKVSLIDSGGYVNAPEPGGLDSMVSERCLQAVEGADAVLLLLDVMDLTPEDEIFMDRLRRYVDKVILVINKVDNTNREFETYSFYQFGFPRMVSISAAHGLNIEELEEALLSILPPEEELSPDSADDDTICLAVLGKPNTGKSTLINALIGHEASIVSPIPGTTRDVIEEKYHYEGHDFRILDTAGIRRKKKVSQNVEYYSVTRAFDTLRDADIVFLMIDSLEGVTDQDKKIAAQAVKWGRGIVLVLNKWDLKPSISNIRQATLDRVRFVFPALDFAPVVMASAIKQTGIKGLMDAAVSISKQLNHRVETGILNRKMAVWNEHYAPPGKKAIRYKVRYITQTRTNPLEFVLFVNRVKGFPAGWIEYLTNRLRGEMGFSSVPLRIELRE